MNEQKLEKISALMDGQLSENEQDVAITELLNNQDSQKTWNEYHLIRDCLNRQQSKLGMNLKQDVFDALEEEPALQMPHARQYRGAWQGFAVAATVAAVAAGIWQFWGATATQNYDTVATKEHAAVQVASGQNMQNQDASANEIVAQQQAPAVPKSGMNPYLRAHQDAMGDEFVQSSLYRGTL